MVTYARADVVSSQGEPCDTVMYVRRGEIQLSVLEQTGKEAIVATLRRNHLLTIVVHE